MKTLIFLIISRNEAKNHRTNGFRSLRSVHLLKTRECKTESEEDTSTREDERTLRWEQELLGLNNSKSLDAIRICTWVLQVTLLNFRNQLKSFQPLWVNYPAKRESRSKRKVFLDASSPSSERRFASEWCLRQAAQWTMQDFVFLITSRT